MTRLTIAAICLSVLSATGVAAQGINEMPTFQYDEIGAKLMGMGYHHLVVVDADAGRMSAYDSDGSEVMIYVDVATRRVLRTDYVHAFDN